MRTLLLILAVGALVAGDARPSLRDDPERLAAIAAITDAAFAAAGDSAVIVLAPVLTDPKRKASMAAAIRAMPMWWLRDLDVQLDRIRRDEGQPGIPSGLVDRVENIMDAMAATMLRDLTAPDAPLRMFETYRDTLPVMEPSP